MISRFGGIEFSVPMPKTEFVRLAEKYPDLPMEREADGTVTIMSPVKKGTGRREFNLSGVRKFRVKPDMLLAERACAEDGDFYFRCHAKA